ncbi:MAG: MaoC family dehydratase [Xanthobacteraceae bacterium]|nr:MaoC family dehydratase [Xanthobacteraceae bacterium]
MPYFEDMKVGDVREFGSYAFTAENIIHFAKRYDPQPFHLSEEAGKKSLFGGLCASGWHTGAACMRKIVDFNKAQYEAALARGEKPVPSGPSPGFKNLKWLKPVYAGDTVTYTSEIVDLRESATRPEWGIMFAKIVGTNQKGERVYEFDSSAFIPRKPK